MFAPKRGKVYFFQTGNENKKGSKGSMVWFGPFLLTLFFI
jgi:hypothetical protein